MDIFDSHCHLDDPSYRKDMDRVLARMTDAGVRAALIAGINKTSVRRALVLAERYANLFISVGVHPHDVKNCAAEDLSELAELAGHEKVRAWGEVGLDFNRMYSPRDIQETMLIRQLELADTLALPLIFHERDSEGRLIDLLKSHPGRNRTGVVHCFSGSRGEMDAYLEMGLYIGITGIVTIQKRGTALREMVPHIPIDRILVETDAPYLTPTPERNRYRRNEPAFVRRVLEKVAEVRGDDLEDLAAQVWDNTCQLFNITEIG
jgi:TatD DNase family protein